MPLPTAPTVLDLYSDAELLREICETVIWGPPPESTEDCSLFIATLRVNLRHLLPLIEERQPQMRGEWKGVASHVVGRARLIAGPQVTEPLADLAQDLAVLCRALLTLYERPVPGVPDASGA
ncbi:MULTISPECIES: hypothetical protein [Streptomyces]|uniref:Uncharacterized protein n=2 Tax=Streptomyces TaxID=1883 RepID=A0ABV9INS9_9ACTN